MERKHISVLPSRKLLPLTRRNVSNSVTVFEGRHPWGVGVTATVVQSGGEAFVFDSLLYPEDSRELLHNIKASSLNVKGLINTHWHWDHTAGNQIFFETSRIVSHSLSSELMRKFLTWDDFNRDAREEDRIRTVYPNESVADGSVLEVGNQEILFLHTPGHTPDSIIGCLKDEDVVIAGDTVMELPYLWYGDSRELIESLRRVQTIAGGGTVVQGHGGTCAGEKLNSDVRYIESLRSAVTECIASGKTAKEVKDIIKLADCADHDVLEKVSRQYEGIHSENVEHVYGEMTQVS